MMFTGIPWLRPHYQLLCCGDQALAAGSETRRWSVDGAPLSKGASAQGIIPAPARVGPNSVDPPL